jgi:hypothetical protein
LSIETANFIDFVLQECYDSVHEQEKTANVEQTAAAARAAQRRSDVEFAQQKHAFAHTAFTQASAALQQTHYSLQQRQHEVHEALESGRRCYRRINACMNEVMGRLNQVQEECQVVLREVEGKQKPECA